MASCSTQGYHGAAVGKGRQLAKTELEKLKLSELTTREAVLEAARMYVLPLSCLATMSSYSNFGHAPYSIHLVHDDHKEKEFELEMSWIGDETGGRHLPVPNDLFEEADRKAREALENFE